MEKKLFLISICVFFILNINAQAPENYVFIKGGKYKMGSKNQPDEIPIHKVKISDFYVLDHEVTNAEYVIFLNEKGNQHEGNTMWIDINGKWESENCKIYEKDSIFYVEKGFENYPVVFVSWWGANAYCKWIGGRLPTEAEWEYLAKLSLPYKEISIDTLDKYAVYSESEHYKYYEIKSKEILPSGVYDLFGNLSEWCQDWYSPYYYKNSEKENPTGPEKGDQKVKRGGSWANKAKSITPSNRKASNPNNNSITIGFRVVIPIGQ
ncbi:MAG: SUMF1/EgtB/PvdO family nonheme iron enzyme [Bacteroidales bacterium]|nr:SUMF1/EgtB/PvdO family nonheme iron enzyme [Bacteroidales bacterium]